jgi:hypothetical protein
MVQTNRRTRRFQVLVDDLFVVALGSDTVSWFAGGNVAAIDILPPAAGV